MQHRISYLDYSNETRSCYPLNVFQIAIKTQSAADCS